MEINKRDTVKFRVKPQMRAELEDAAASHGMRLSEFLRWLVDDYLKGNPTNVDDQQTV